MRSTYIPVELPALESLPQATCRVCGKPKIMGLFTPREIVSGDLRCRACTGDVNSRNKPIKPGKKEPFNPGNGMGAL